MLRRSDKVLLTVRYRAVRTDNLYGTIRMKLANIARSEPLPSVFLEEVFFCLLRQLVIARGNDVAADQNLTPGVWVIRDSVTSFLPILQFNVAHGGGCSYSPGASVVHYDTNNTMQQRSSVEYIQLT